MTDRLKGISANTYVSIGLLIVLIGASAGFAADRAGMKRDVEANKEKLREIDSKQEKTNELLTEVRMILSRMEGERNH